MSRTDLVIKEHNRQTRRRKKKNKHRNYRHTLTLDNTISNLYFVNKVKGVQALALKGSTNKRQDAASSQQYQQLVDQFFFFKISFSKCLKKRKKNLEYCISILLYHLDNNNDYIFNLGQVTIEIKQTIRKKTAIQ